MTTAEQETRPDLYGPCPCCGAYALPGAAQPSALLAVCDVLCIKALEVVGKRIVRVTRARFSQLGNQPWHTAHLKWRPDGSMIEKALSGAWDVIPAMLYRHGCCDVTARQVTDMVDSYVRDLLITGTEHSLPELAYRFKDRLALPVGDGHDST